MRCRLEGGRELIELPMGQYLLRTPWDGFATALDSFPLSVRETFYSVEEVLIEKGVLRDPLFATYFVRIYPSLADYYFNFPCQKGLETVAYTTTDQSPTAIFRTKSISQFYRPSLSLLPNWVDRESFADGLRVRCQNKVDIFCPKADKTS